MPHRAFDALTVRCPQLGGEVSFAYCRTLQDGLPCRRALVCFERRFPVTEYFTLVLKAKTYQRIFSAPAQNRLDTLLKITTEERSKKSE